MEADGHSLAIERKNQEKKPAYGRDITLTITYNYEERKVEVPFNDSLLDEIKKQAHAVFSLSCIRLEVDGHPLLSPNQIFTANSPKITVFGIKNKCFLLDCRNRASGPLKRTCRFCKKPFCIRHSIPESHQCERLSDCKKKAVNDNLQQFAGIKRGPGP